ncbi:MAG: hypothetical protein PWP31_295 [Clostridia bacterium]|nr:hypothetical protein [Clostridia bacterium]
MILAALIAIYLWRREARWTFFVLGGLSWLISVFLKGVLAFYINRFVYAGTQQLPPLISGLSYWTYVGLLTGIFEVGIVYFFATSTHSLRRARWQEAIAFGIGFGSLEAIFLGILSLITVIWGLQGTLLPAIVAPFMIKEGVILWVLAPIVERVFTILIHTFAAVVTIYSVRIRLLRWFWLAFIYKTATDAVVAYAQMSYGLHTLQHVWTIEAVVATFGLVGLLGIAALRRNYDALW